MVGRGGAGPAGSGWSLSTRTFRRENPSRRALRGAVRPRRRLVLAGRGTGFRRAPRAGRSRPLFGPSLFPVAAGGGGMERRRRGRGGTIPAGRAGRAQCLLGAGRGASGAVGWGEILGAAEIPLRRGREPSMPRPPCRNSYKLSTALPAIVTFHGPRSPDTQAPSYLAKNGGRKPRPHPPSK